MRLTPGVFSAAAVSRGKLSAPFVLRLMPFSSTNPRQGFFRLMSKPGVLLADECWMRGGLPAGLVGSQPDWAVAASMAVAMWLQRNGCGSHAGTLAMHRSWDDPALALL